MRPIFLYSLRGIRILFKTQKIEDKETHNKKEINFK
jgi:hypothetical protein